MNNHKDETNDSTIQNNAQEASRCEEKKGSQETALGDLQPRTEIKGGSIYQATDVTLKRGIVG